MGLNVRDMVDYLYVARSSPLGLNGISTTRNKSLLEVKGGNVLARGQSRDCGMYRVGVVYVTVLRIFTVLRVSRIMVGVHDVSWNMGAQGMGVCSNCDWRVCTQCCMILGPRTISLFLLHATRG